MRLYSENKSASFDARVTLFPVLAKYLIPSHYLPVVSIGASDSMC